LGSFSFGLLLLFVLIPQLADIVVVYTLADSEVEKIRASPMNSHPFSLTW
jgi:hypothetical protein